MKKTTKIILIICVSMVGAGAVLCLIGWLMGGRVTAVGLNGNGEVFVYGPDMENTTKEYHVYSDTLTGLEAFRNIHLDVDYADVSVVPSDHYGLEYQLVEHAAPLVALEDGSLTLTRAPETSENIMWFYRFYSGPTSSYPSTDEYVIVYVPHDAVLGNLTISNESGSVSLRGLNAQKLDLNAEYGDVTISKSDCPDVIVQMDSGELEITGLNSSRLSVSNEYGNASLSEVTAAESTELTLDSGYLDMVNVSAGNLTLNMEYGDLTGSYIVMDDATIRMSSGDCDMDYCEFQNIDIDSEYGSVDLMLTGSLEYNYDIVTEYGEASVMGATMGERYQSIDNTRSNTIRVRCESGDVTINR